MRELEYYIEVFRDENQQLVDAKFTGNVEFKVNYKEGGIANMNCSLNKSVKMLKEVRPD